MVDGSADVDLDGFAIVPTLLTAEELTSLAQALSVFNTRRVFENEAVYTPSATSWTSHRLWQNWPPPRKLMQLCNPRSEKAPFPFAELCSTKLQTPIGWSLGTRI